MSEKAPNQASSKDDLDQLSAIEESMASFGMGDLDSEHGVTLKDWSAQDFANVYVRFRPHLISHARKFLREETQAEEVVQDAFLYLMTALPELDSELGVLRFLKWKVRLLALDSIRRDSKSGNSTAFDFDSISSSDESVEDSIVRADDAAIVGLAIAKLSDNQRRALVLSYLEEKSTSVAAKEMGLAPNAYRQLLLRSRRSLRKVLIGDLETSGLSLSEFLSSASRKKAVRATLTGLSVLLATGFGLSSISIENTDIPLSLVSGEVKSEGLRFSGDLPIDPRQQDQEVLGTNNLQARDLPTPNNFVEEPVGNSPSELEESQVLLSVLNPGTGHSGITEKSPSHSPDSWDGSVREFADTYFATLLKPSLLATRGSHILEQARVEQELENKSLVQVTFLAEGFIGGLTLSSLGENRVSSLWIEFSHDNSRVAVTPTNTLEVAFERDGKQFIELTGTDLIFGDLGGLFEYRSFAALPSSENYIRLLIDASNSGLEEVVEIAIFSLENSA